MYKVMDKIGHTFNRDNSALFHSSHYEKLAQDGSEEDLDADEEVVFIRSEMQANGQLHEEPLMGHKSRKKVRIDEEHLGGDFREETGSVHVRKLRNILLRKIFAVLIFIIICLLIGGSLMVLLNPSNNHPTSHEWTLQIPGIVSNVQYMHSGYSIPKLIFPVFKPNKYEINIVESILGSSILNIYQNFSKVNLVLCNIDLDLDSDFDCIISDGDNRLVALCPENGKIFWDLKNISKNASLVNIELIMDINNDGIKDLILIFSNQGTNLVLISGRNGQVIGSPITAPENLIILYKFSSYTTKDSQHVFLASSLNNSNKLGILLAICFDNLISKFKNEITKFDNNIKNEWPSVFSYSGDNIFFKLFSTNETFVYHPVISEIKDSSANIFLITANQISLLSGQNLNVLWIFRFNEYYANGSVQLFKYNEDLTQDLAIIVHSKAINNLQSKLLIIDGLKGLQLSSLNVYTLYPHSLYAVHVGTPINRDLIILQNYSKPNICYQDSRPRRSSIQNIPFRQIPRFPPVYSKFDYPSNVYEYVDDNQPGSPLLNRRRTDPPYYPLEPPQSEYDITFNNSKSTVLIPIVNSSCIPIISQPQDIVFFDQCTIRKLNMPNKLALVQDLDLDGTIDALTLQSSDAKTYFSKFNLEINYIAYLQMLNETSCRYDALWSLI